MVLYKVKDCLDRLKVDQKLSYEWAKLYAHSRNTEELKGKLMEFKGIGEVTSQIFLRELRGVWKIDVPVSIKAAEMAERMNIDLEEFEGEKLTRIEDALVKLYLRYGKKGKQADTLPTGILALLKT